MTELSKVIAELRRPFTPEAVKFKIQTNPKERNGRVSNALVVAFMDSRLAAERLNATCPGDWSDSYSPAVLGNGIVCHLTVCGATRSDAGWVDANRLDSDMGLKGLYSDAFKRAAVKFGIGAFLYALPKMYVAANDLNHVGNSWYLPREAERKLRRDYEAWLKQQDRFGEPLDHGDAEDSQGDPDAVDAPPVEEPAKPKRVKDVERTVKSDVPVNDQVTPKQYDELKALFDKAGSPVNELVEQLDLLGVRRAESLPKRIAACTVEQGEALAGWLRERGAS